MNIVVSVLTSFFVFVSAHPLHVSVTDINFDEKEKSLEIMVRIFIDDTEQTLRKNLGQQDLDILKPKNTTTDQLLKDYALKHLSITLDNKMPVINYLGHEVDGEAFMLYMEVTKVKKWKTITVKNDIFMESFDDQSNIVNVTASGNTRSLRLTSTNYIDKLTFDDK